MAASLITGDGERFTQWVAANYLDGVCHNEVSMTTSRVADGQWKGSVDLLLRLPGGEVVVVDHKSGPVRRNS